MYVCGNTNQLRDNVRCVKSDKKHSDKIGHSFEENHCDDGIDRPFRALYRVFIC